MKRSCLAVILLICLLVCSACKGQQADTDPSAGTTGSPDGTVTQTPITTKPPDISGGEDDTEWGTSDAALGTADYRDGVLTAQAQEGGRFIGWSVDRTLAAGADLLSDGTEYTPGQAGVYIANFVPVNGFLVRYACQAGDLAGDAVWYSELFVSDFHLCPNAIGDTGIIVRPGCNLLEFNTEPDGSGTGVNPGGKIAAPAGWITLYPIFGTWAPASDFRVTQTGDGCAIVGYTGSAETLHIPAEINGMAVTQISTGAFSDASFRTVSLPRSVRRIEQNAFAFCRSLSSLYMPDTVTSVPNEAFSGCTALSHLYLNAACPPVYTSSSIFGSCSVKFERLLTRDDTPLVVVLGGSSVIYGLDCGVLEEELGTGMYAINYGTNQGTTGLVYMEMITHFLREGDLFISAPEYGGKQYGSTEFDWKLIRELENCYNILRYVDLTKYTNVFQAFTDYNTYRSPLPPASYTDTTGCVDFRGDGLDNTVQKEVVSMGSVGVSPGLLSDAAADAFNRLFDRFAANGVTVCMTFPPLYEGSLRADSNVAGFLARLDEKLHAKVISDPYDYLFAYDCFYDNHYHLLRSACADRARLLAADILAAQQNGQN